MDQQTPPDQTDAGPSAQTQPQSQGQPPAPPARRRSKLPMILLAVVILGGALLFGITTWLDRNEETTDDAFVDGHVINMMSQDSGAIMQMRVKDNQFVHKGDLLLVIDQRNYTAELDQAKGNLATSRAQLLSAQATLAKAKISYPADLAAAQAELASSQAQLRQAELDAARQHNIPLAATSKQSIDQADAALLRARASVAQAQAQVASNGVVNQQIAIAAAAVQQRQGEVLAAQAKLASAYADFYNTTVTAPADGWITRKNVEVGTFVQPGSQLFDIVTPDVFVTANFKEGQLARMRAGDPAAIKIDAYPGLKLRGHVDSIQLGTGSRFTAFPAENATGNFVKIVQRVPVKILIDSGLDPNRPLSLGLSADPTVTVR